MHGTLLDGLGGPPLDDATVVVRGAKIEYAGRSRSSVRSWRRAGNRRQRPPYYSGTCRPSCASTRRLERRRQRDSRLPALPQWAGVTTVLDTGNYQPWIVQLRQEQAVGRLLAPRIYCVGAMIDGADPTWPDLRYALTSAFHIQDPVGCLLLAHHQNRK